MFTATQSALLADICKEWNRAEIYIKLAEQVAKKVVGPAVAELRYAGRRMVDAMTAAQAGKSEAEIQALLEDARFNCHRARHDAIDAATSKMAVDLDLWSSKLGYKAVLTAYPRLEDFLRRLDDAQTKISLTRKNREQRDEIYEAIAAVDFEPLVEDYKTIKRSEAIMKRIAAKDRIAFWIAVLLAIGGYILAFYFWRYPAVPTNVPDVIQTDVSNIGS